jgi:ABC-type polysaccharide transport system permease subunit
MSSLFTNDIHELLLYLLRIKNLYIELVNRYYLVYSKFANLKNYYLFNRVIKPNWIGKKKFVRQNFKKLKRKEKINIPFIYQYKLKKNIKNKYYYAKDNYT